MNEILEAEGQLNVVPESFRLDWVWHNDGWHLARNNGSNFTIFMPTEFKLSNVIEGPFAADITAAPKYKPSFEEK